MARFTEVKYMYSVVRDHGVEPDGGFTGRDEMNGGFPFSANFPLFLIQEAWNRGMDVEDLADGFGESNGTRGDWSAIRDSTTHATTKMFERALNYLFGDEDTSPAARFRAIVLQRQQSEHEAFLHEHDDRTHSHPAENPARHYHDHPPVDIAPGDPAYEAMAIAVQQSRGPVRRGSHADHAAEFPEQGNQPARDDVAESQAYSVWGTGRSCDDCGSHLTGTGGDLACQCACHGQPVSFERHAED